MQRYTVRKPNFKTRCFISRVHGFNHSVTLSSGKIGIDIIRRKKILVMIIFFIHDPHRTHRLK